MGFLEGLHGTVAAILICSLLFVDEAGIPLPVAPNEGLLLLTGVLVSSGAFPLWGIFPAAFLAMAGGMMAGYSWARTIGYGGLQTIATHLHATEVLNRAQARLKEAGPAGIAASRMLPGVRPYATMVSGAAAVNIRTFLFGALPALLLWEVIWILAGMLIGLPLAHFLGRFELVMVRGAILIMLGGVAWLAVRDVSVDRRGGLTRVAPRLRPSLALVVDTAIVVSLIGGLFEIGRRALHVGSDRWLELVAAAILLTVLLVAGRRHQTPGETLFDTHYWHHIAIPPG